MKRVQLLIIGVILGLLLTVTGCGMQSLNNLTANSPLAQTVKDKLTGKKSTHKTQPDSSQQPPSVTQSSSTQTITKSPTSTTKAQQTPLTNKKAGSSASVPTGATVSSGVVSEIQKHLQNQEQQFTVRPPSSGKIGDVFKVALSQDPYIHWIVSSYDISSDGAVATINVNYRETKQQTAFVDSRVQQIVSSILKPGMTNVYKEYLIHNWIVTHLQYDTSLQNDTAYEALQSGKAVCQGYALLAYRMLMDAGIPTKIETGNAGGQSHMWNEVSINGKWYQFDATWDDPVGDAPGDVSYAYFNVTNPELAHSHQWNQSKFPVANTDFTSQLKSLVKSDPNHASEYATILDVIGANLPVAVTPNAAHQLIQQAIQKKKRSIDFIISSTEANSTDFMSQADRQLVSSRPVSLQYSAATYVRKGQNACRVHLTFNY